MASRTPWQQEELRKVLAGRLIEETKTITLGPGTEVRLKSGTEGWIRATIVDYYDVLPAVGGYMYGGGMTPGYSVKILEGKHKGETIKVPLNYVEPVGVSIKPKKSYRPSPWR